MNFEDLEAGTLRPPPLPLPQVVAHAVFQINTKVAALRHLGDALGTPKDTRALRGRLRVTRAEAMRLAKITSQKLKQAAETADDGAGATKTMAPGSESKLAMDFHAALSDLQQALRRIAASESDALSAAAAAATFAGQTQQQLLAAGREEDHGAIVDDRELGKLEAEHAIAEIDNIFSNLVTLVDDPGGSVGHVVCDIEGPGTPTSQAAVEEIAGMVEEEAPVTRSSASCLLMFALGLFLLIFVLVFVYVA